MLFSKPLKVNFTCYCLSRERFVRVHLLCPSVSISEQSFPRHISNLRSLMIQSFLQAVSSMKLCLQNKIILSCLFLLLLVSCVIQILRDPLAMESVTGTWRGTNRQRLFNELGWETLHDRRRYHRLCHSFSLIKSKSPEYLFSELPQA